MNATEIAALSDQELSEEIAKALGWAQIETDGPLKGCWVDPNDPPEWQRKVLSEPPSFIDLNALKAGPERVLRERGWELDGVHELPLEGRWMCIWYRVKGGHRITVLAATEERARAEASLLGLQTQGEPE